MMLSRLFLNPMNRDVQRALGDVVRMHQFVMRGFPEGDTPAARRAHGVLHRCDRDERAGHLALLVQSRTVPDWSRLPAGCLLDLGDDLENPATRSLEPVLAALAPGVALGFRLRANATRKVHPDERKHGQRVPVRGDEGRIEWLARKAAASGFSIESADVRVVEEPSTRGWSPAKRVVFVGTLFDGTLHVTDAARLKAAVEGGIGPGKAYGFGLLSLSRPR